MKPKIYKVFEEYYGVGDAIWFASEKGIIEMANRAAVNKCGIVRDFETAKKVLDEEGYCIEEQTDIEVEWEEEIITFTQGV